MKILTQEYLKELYHYEDGKLFWKERRRGRKFMSEAGTPLLSGYREIVIDGKKYRRSRLVWMYFNGNFPAEQIDHINHIRTDDRLDNLREVSHQENHRNQTKPKNNTSGMTGVSYNKAQKRWHAYIIVDQKKIHLGYSKDVFEAACLRKAAEKEYGFHANHGEKI